MSEKDIVERLNEACTGWPFAKVFWPHRLLLHDARDTILSLRRNSAAMSREIARLTMRVTELEDEAGCAAIDRALLSNRGGE